MKAFHLKRRTIPIALCDEPFHLNAQFLVERLAESIRRQDDRIPAQLPFGMDIGLAEFLPTDGHMLTLVCMPDKLTPVAAIGVDCAAEIEYIAFHAYSDD